MLVLNLLSENPFIFALPYCVKDRWSFFFPIKTVQFISGIEKEIISIKCGQTKKDLRFQRTPGLSKEKRVT